MALREIEKPGPISRSIPNEACCAIGGRKPGWFTKATCPGVAGPEFATVRPDCAPNGPAMAAGVMQALFPGAGVVHWINPCAKSAWKIVADPAIFTVLPLLNPPKPSA